MTPDTCTEDGGTAYCVDAETGPYTYQVAAAGTGAVQATSEAAVIAGFYPYLFQYVGACTLNQTNNLPPYPSVPQGAGSQSSGSYSDAFYYGNGQYWSLNWTLSVEASSTRMPLVYTATRYPSNNCQSGTLGPFGAYVQRNRSVQCPGGYTGPFRPNLQTTPSNAYCYRASDLPEPAKNLGGACGAGSAGSSSSCSATDASSQLVGNPVNPYTGNKFQAETDYVGQGPMPLGFIRYYNSQLFQGGGSPLGLQSALGPSWRSSYDRQIFFIGVRYPTAYAYRPDGKTLHFKLTGGQFVAEPDVADQLVRLVDGSGNITGWKYTVAANDEVETYNADGTLASLTSRAGLVQTLSRDANGRLSAVTDAFGHTLTFGYNSTNQLFTMTDPAGRVYTYAYNSVGNVSSVTDPGGAIRTYVYNEPANTGNTNQPYALTGILDESNGRYATFQYNSSGKTTSSAHAGSADSYSFSYGSQTTVTDPLGTARIFGYSTVLGVSKSTSVNKTCIVGCAGAQAATSYDSNGNVASRTDFNGVQTHYGYDLARNLETSRTEAYGTPVARTITTQWNATWRLPNLITEPNRTTAYTYDSKGNVLTKAITDTSVTPNVSRTWTYTYDSYGRALTATGPRTDVNSTTMYLYYTCTTGYQCGQLQTVTDAVGNVTTYNTYNAYGQPLTITDPNGVVTTLTYDARLRLTSRQIGSETTSFSYYPTGLLKQVTLPDASYVQYTYDGAHRLTKVTDSAGNYISYTLDAMGNRTAESTYDPSSSLHRAHTRVYNALNELYQDVNAAGTSAVTTTYGYDGNGNQNSIDAPIIRFAANGYDALNRLNQITDAENGVTQFTYDANDNLTSVKDPRNLITSYSYNGFGDLTQQLSPDTGTSTNTYDSGGNLSLATDARGSSANYTYDAANRVTQILYKNGGVTDQTLVFGYDSGTNGKGHLTSAGDGNHALSWTYDALGRVTGKGQTVGTVTTSVGYGYTNGNLTALVTPSGQSIGYSYNANHEITGITANGTTLLSGVTYEPFAGVSGWTWGNGTLGVRSYDQDGNLVQLNDAGHKTYTYDNASRIAGVADGDDPSLSLYFTYDSMDRLATSSSTPSPPAGPAVTATPTSVVSGQAITVTASGLAGNSGLWLALAMSSAPATTYSQWIAVPTGSSFVWNPTAPSFAGTYEVRLYSGNFHLVATSAAITVTAGSPPGQPTLYVNAADAAAGASVTARLASGAGGSTDWLALAQVGASASSYITWTYVGSGVTNRDWTVTMPTTQGNYEFRYFLNNSYTITAGSPAVAITNSAPVSGGGGGGGGGGSGGYNYDLNGNRLSGEGSTETMASGSNQLLTVTGALNRTYMYDAAGNVRGYGSLGFAYNNRGRMNTASTSSGSTSYLYNALGQLIEKATSSSSNLYVYDESGHLLGEYDGSGTLIEETVWLGEIPVGTLKPNGSGGVNIFYVHTDHLNTPRRITRPSDNAFVWRWDSDPFGTTAPNQNPSGLGTFTYNLRFPGQYYMAETGLNQNVNRDYDPLTGKYIESDPIGLRGGINTYAYAYDNPIRFVDPQGLAIWICSRAVNGFPFFGNHSYLWNDQTRKSCGKRGSSGLGPLGEGEKGPDGDSCTKVPGSDGLEGQVMSCCTKTANLAPWVPVVSDCNNLAGDCIESAGLKNPGAPGGRLGSCSSCNTYPTLTRIGEALATAPLVP